MSPLMWLLAGLASARTFRLLTVDGAGYPVRRRWDDLVWRIMPKEAKGVIPYIRRKDVSKWTWKRYRAANSMTTGWSCPFCFGYWLCVAWVGSGLLWNESWLWQIAAGSFALSYVVGHVCARLDDGEPNDD